MSCCLCINLADKQAVTFFFFFLHFQPLAVFLEEEDVWKNCGMSVLAGERACCSILMSFACKTPRLRCPAEAGRGRDVKLTNWSGSSFQNVVSYVSLVGTE